jgi:hypothetical protein
MGDPKDMETEETSVADSEFVSVGTVETSRSTQAVSHDANPVSWLYGQ